MPRSRSRRGARGRPGIVGRPGSRPPACRSSSDPETGRVRGRRSSPKNAAVASRALVRGSRIASASALHRLRQESARRSRSTDLAASQFTRSARPPSSTAALLPALRVAPVRRQRGGAEIKLGILTWPRPAVRRYELGEAARALSAVDGASSTTITAVGALGLARHRPLGDVMDRMTLVDADERSGRNAVRGALPLSRRCERASSWP